MSFSFFRVAVIGVLAWGSASGFAQDFPAKPIRIIVGAQPGGGSDNIIRKVAQVMQQQTNATITVEYRPGASGSIAVLATVRSPADGYTLTICPPDTIAVYPQLKKVPPYTLENLTPIARLAEVNYIFAVKPSNPARNIGEFVKSAKEQATPLNFGSPGVQTSARMVTEMFMQRTGVKMQNVPYQGDGPMLAAMAAGDLDFVTTAFVSAKPFLDSGKIKAIGLVSDQRVPEFSTVPTVDEGGLKDFSVAAWFGIFGPKGIPPDVTRKLSDMFVNAVNSDDFREFARSRGITPKGQGSADFDRFLRGNLPLWADAIKAANLPLED